MIELRTLGSLELRSTGAHECDTVLRQPKRLALLAYLACAAPHRFHRRDSLLALFWPDRDTAHARAALRRALHFLRTALGDDTVVGRGDEEVGVASEALWCDSRAFAEAVREGRRDAALELYRGDFLDGFFINSAPEFERWLDSERTSLRTTAAREAWSLVEAAEPQDPTAAIAYARRALELTPFEEEPLRRFMQLLDRLGDRATALTAFADYTKRLAEEFEVTPSDETVELAKAIRSKGAAPEVVSDAVRPVRAPQVLAVLPFSVSAPAPFAYLAEGMVDLLSTKLDGTRALRVADPRTLFGWLAQRGDRVAATPDPATVAAEFGAEHVLMGSVVVGGDRIQLTATMYGRDGTHELVAEATGEAENELFDLVDEIARQLLASRSTGPAGRVARLAAHTTRSLPALKQYLEGEHQFRAGRYFQAIAAYQQAAAADPSFALAQYRLAAALAACAMPDGARAAAHQARSQRARLAPHDRLLLDAQAAWLDGRATDAERFYSDIVEQYPEGVEAWFLLGDLLFHHNPYRGRSISEARTPLERAIALDRDHVSALGHLARIAALERRTDDVASLVGRVLAASATGDQALPMRALRAFTLRDTNEATEVLHELKAARALTIGIAFSDVAVYSGNIGGTEQFAQEFLAVARSPALRALCHIIIAHVQVMRGQFALAWQSLDSARELDRAWGIEAQGLMAAWPFYMGDPEKIRQVRDDVEAWDAAATPPSPDLPLRVHNDLHPSLRLYLLGLLHARLGDTERAAACVAALQSAATERTTLLASLAAGVEARIAWERGDYRRALAILEAVQAELWFQQAVASPFFGRNLERFMRAELLRTEGRTTEARSWYQALAQRSPFELPFRPIADARLHGMASDAGDTAAAAVYEARLREAWEPADREALAMMARYAPKVRE